MNGQSTLNERSTFNGQSTFKEDKQSTFKEAEQDEFECGFLSNLDLLKKMLKECHTDETKTVKDAIALVASILGLFVEHELDKCRHNEHQKQIV